MSGELDKDDQDELESMRREGKHGSGKAHMFASGSRPGIRSSH